MKKYLLMLVAAAAMAFTSCNKVATEMAVESVDNSDVKVIFDIEVEGATRAVKTEWAVGDQVIAFLDDNVDADMQLVFTYGEDGWDYELGSSFVFHKPTGLVQAAHVPGTMVYDSSSKVIKSNGGVALITPRAAAYSYNSVTKELTIDTITLGYGSQFQVTVPGIDAEDGYYLMVSSSSEVELQGSTGRYYYRPKAGSAIAADNVDNGNGIVVSAQETGTVSLSAEMGMYQIDGVPAEDGCAYVATLYSNADDADQYHFFLGTYFERQNQPQLWEYVVDKSASKTLRSGSAIMLPPLSEWKVVFQPIIVEADVTISNPFPGFGDPAKSAWMAGDKLSIWRDYVPEDKPEIVLEYDGSQWNITSLADGLEFGNATFTAVYEGHNDLEHEFSSSLGRDRNNRLKADYFKRPNDIYAYASMLSAYGKGNGASLADNKLTLAISDWNLMTPVKVVLKNAPSAPISMEALVNPHLAYDADEGYSYLDYDESASTVLGSFTISENRSAASFSVGYEDLYAGAIAEGDNKVFYLGSVDSGSKSVSFTVHFANEYKHWILNKPAMKVLPGQSTMTVVELDYNDPAATVLIED